MSVSKGAAKKRGSPAKYLALLLVLSAFGFAVGFGIGRLAKLWCGPDTQTCTVTLVEEIPASLTEDIQRDRETPGMFIYEANGHKYILLTFGRTVEYAMEVEPHIDGMSVHFAVGATPVSNAGARPEYRVYQTDAETISCDEYRLSNPGYGPGAAGMNYGWVQPTSDGTFHITPLLDTTPMDRVFLADMGVTLQRGLYYYEYEVRSTGSSVTFAQRLEQYDLSARIGQVDDNGTTCDILVPDGNVRATCNITGLSENDIEYLRQAAGQSFIVRMTLKDTQGILTIATVHSPQEPTEDIETIPDEAETAPGPDETFGTVIEETKEDTSNER